MIDFKNMMKLATHFIVALIVLTGFYYLKYRPVRNAYQKTKAANVELQKQLQARDKALNAVALKYYELAGIPRYQIDQYLDRIKVKRNSTLEFVPDAVMKVADSLEEAEPLLYNDSIIIKKTVLDSVMNKPPWWQFWNKRDK